MCVRPQNAVTHCGMHITFVVEGGQGHASDMVGEGACEMITGDESCCSLMALAM